MPTVSASALCEKPFFERSRRTLPAKRSSRLMTNSVRRVQPSVYSPMGARCALAPHPVEGASRHRPMTVWRKWGVAIRWTERDGACTVAYSEQPA